MGCWNKTCGLSNLHINAGEEVYTFILQKSNVYESSSHCYSTHLYQPIIVPFYSKYDDYGAGEENHGIGLNLILESLKKNLVEKEVGKNTYHDIAVKKENFDENLLFESMREGRLFVKNLFGSLEESPETKIEFLMMKKSVVDSILNNYKIEKCTYIREIQKLIYNYESFNDIVKEIDKFIELVQKDLQQQEKFIESTTNEKDKDIAKIRMMLPQMWHYQSLCKQHNLKLEEWLRYDSDIMGGGSSRLLNICQIFVDFLKENKIEEAKELLTDFLKGCFIMRFMEDTRRSWIPQCGEGSQNIEFDAHKLLSQTVLKIVEQEKKEREEW